MTKNKYLPTDILQYVLEKELDSDFLTSVLLHKENFTIAEIGDKKILDKGDHLRIKSQAYDISTRVDDLEIVAAFKQNMYISVFLARKENEYQIHFLVHRYKVDEKAFHEEEIAREVVQYIILKTIIGLRLDTPEKVDKYCSR